MHLRPVARPRGGLLLGLAAILAAAAPAAAEPATVTIRIQWIAQSEVRGFVTAKARDGRVAPVEAPFRCVPDSPCVCRLELPDAAAGWLISAAAPGFWQAPVDVGSGEAVELWPTANLEGEIGKADSPESIDEIGAKFSPSPGSKGPKGYLREGIVTCPVRERRFACVIPAGTFDLRLRAKGHVSIYRWREELAPGATLRLGSIGFRRGASLVGRVVSTDRDAPKPGACTVRLEPPGVSTKAKGNDEYPSSGVDKNGFFHLQVVPPGKWVVVAEQEGFAAARRAVTILERMEANLNEPLVLARPARLELNLLPPQDPAGKPWMVELLDVTDTGRAEPLVNVPASIAGFWAKDRLSTGRRLVVRARTSDGHAWWADGTAFELAGPVHRRNLDLGFEEVDGTLRLGETPLAGQLAFGAPEENISIALRSGSDGKVSGALPRLGKWRVLVTSESPSVRREIDVELTRGPNGRGRVEIILEDRALIGEIVDENGKRLDRAILTISAKAANSREVTQEFVEGGAFRLTGYAPGGYLLKAEGSGRVSETVVAEIAADGSSPFLKIVAVPNVSIDLRVVTEGGTPVAAANLNILQTTVFPGLTTISRRTDASGRASFKTNPGIPQQCFVVSQAGLTTKVFSVSPSPDEQEVVLPGSGGTLEIRKPAPNDGEAIVLWQGPCYLPSGLLGMIGRGDGATLMEMAPGEYRLCRHSLVASPAPPVCSGGYLTPLGRLSLDLGPQPR